MAKILSFNVESDGPYGEVYAVGAVVLNEEGEEIDRFAGIAEKDQIENRRVRETVLPVLGELREYKTRREMRDDFWKFYMKHMKNSIHVVDKGIIDVERLFDQVIQDDPENRKQYKPHPISLNSVSVILRQNGIDPHINRIKYSGLNGLDQFNPADKALASAVAFFKAINPESKLKENELKEDKKMENVLEISKLADELGKKPIKRTLPNGKEVEQIVWTGEDLVKLSQIMHNKPVPEGMHIKINGAAPAWLVASITHELHPNSVSVNSPDGYVPIGMKKPSGMGGGENLKWTVLKNKDWHIVQVEQNDPSEPLNPKDLDNAFPPELPMGSKVILSGRMPNWLAASATMAYHGTTKAVALYQPGTGATVAMTHSQSVKLGEVIPEDIVKEAKPVGELEKELDNLEKIDVAEEKPRKGLKI
ncbi:CRISPR-associated protein Csx3 [Thermicanus aegyptius]|uniref:CRISPR-associated protein Csx3 n=1 Tax=Thermicanus aegyptius TaxID=94009 RepID=UPI0004162519|nr:CRISPR-associated protein Csx3 [Thermicanus aegyptius]